MNKLDIRRIGILSTVVFYLSVASAQETQDYMQHRIMVAYGMGYANSIYNKTDEAFMHTNYSVSSAVEVRYAYFFRRNWGVSMGAGLSYFNAKGTLNMEGVIPHYADPAFDPSGKRYYDLRYKANNLAERQRIWALEMPLQFHFERRNASGKRGVFAGLGVKGFFPVISTESAFQQGSGTLTLTGYEAFTDALYTDPPHFGLQEVRKTPATTKLRCSVDAIADFGGLFRVSDIFELYVGAYGSYGFMDVLPKVADKKDFITPEYNNLFFVNSLLSSNILSEYNKSVQDNHLNWKTANEKWHRWQAGIKIGMHFKLGGK